MIGKKGQVSHFRFSLQALEYAKVQVMRNQPLKEGKNRPDPTEQYVNSLFPANDDDERQGSCKWNELAF